MENVRRFRTATIVCFAAAVLLLFAAASYGRPYSNFTQSAASLGVAFWLAGFALTFFLLYFRMTAARGRETPPSRPS
jgi:hypothetical protein